MADASPLSESDREDLVAYLDGELRGPEAAALEAKLSLNANARAEAEGLRRTWELLDHLPRPDPSPEFTHRTMELVSTQLPAPVRVPGRRLSLARLAWTVAVVVLGVVGFLAGRQLVPDPPPSSVVPEKNADEILVRDLGVIENRLLYQYVDDLGFLRTLADPNDPDLFGNDPSAW